MRGKATLLNIISGLLLQCCTLISGFVIPRIVLTYFGSDVNGLVSSLNQFLSYITLVEGGISGVIIANLYKPLVDGDNEKLSSVMVTSDRFYKKIGCIFIVYSLFLACLYPAIFKQEFSYLYVASLDSHKPGLPLGYYPSQWFGNFYLQPLDHFIMEQLHVKHYIRYMDDMVIFGNNKKELHKARLQIEKFITEELGLQIKKNWQVFRFDYVDRKGKRRGRPLDFMGFKFYRDRTTIRKSILQGIRGKVNRVKRKEKITWVDAGSLLSRLGWIWHSDTYAYYERYIKPYVKVKVLKTLVSKHARKENIRNGMVRSRKHRRRKTERA